MYKLKTITSNGKKYRGDAGLLREAVDFAGVKLYGNTIFSDGNKTTRRLKIYMAGALFAASDKQKEMFMERLKHNFGNRVVKYGRWISTPPYNIPSFYIVVTESEAVKADRKERCAYVTKLADQRYRLARQAMGN